MNQSLMITHKDVRYDDFDCERLKCLHNLFTVITSTVTRNTFFSIALKTFRHGTPNCFIYEPDFMNHLFITSWNPELKQQCLYRFPPLPTVSYHFI